MAMGRGADCWAKIAVGKRVETAKNRKQMADLIFKVGLRVGYECETKRGVYHTGQA